MGEPLGRAGAPSMAFHDLPGILPLASAFIWSALAAATIARRRFTSPFERSLAAFAILVGAWAFLDWIFLAFRDPTEAGLAILVSNVRITLMTFATLALLLATKWIALGHARSDVLYGLPVAGSLAIIWTGLTSGVEPAEWGLSLVRDPILYAAWATQQVAYVIAAIALVARLYAQRRSVSRSVRRRFFLTLGSLSGFLGLGIATNLLATLTGSSDVPWFSALLIVPGTIALVAVVPLSPEEYGGMLRAVTAIQERVTAVYLFYRSGEPLVALASGRNLPIEAEQLEGLLAIVGNFVETGMPASRGYAVTAMRYDGMGIVAVRGEFVIAAAVYDGPAYDTLRSELMRVVRAFEDRRWRDLGTWEEATRVAEDAADELSSLLYMPDRRVGGKIVGRPPRDAKPRETT